MKKSDYLMSTSLALLLVGAFGAPQAFADAKKDKHHGHKAHHEHHHSMKSEIEALKAQLAALSERLNEVQTAEKEVKAPHIKSGNDKVSLKISGHVNRAVANYDNGKNSQFKHVDNDTSSTRVTFAGDVKFNEVFKAGTVIEGELVSDSSRAVSLGTQDQAKSSSFFAKRKMEVFFTNKDLGTLWLGHGETAAHNVSNTDLSGTTAFAEGAKFESIAGGIPFFNNTTGGIDSVPGVTTPIGTTNASNVASFWNEMGTRRFDRVRYDMPSFYGITLSASHATRDQAEFAARYAGEFNKVQIVAAAGYIRNPLNTATADNAVPVNAPGNVSRDQYGASAAVLLPVGVSLGGGFTGIKFNQTGRDDGKMWHLKLGYQHDFFSYGKTCVAVAYGYGKAMRFASKIVAAGAVNEADSLTQARMQNSEKMKIWGLYLVQNVDKISTELYAGYQVHKLDRQTFSTVAGVGGVAGGVQDIKNVSAVMAGARIKF